MLGMNSTTSSTQSTKQPANSNYTQQESDDASTTQSTAKPYFSTYQQAFNYLHSMPATASVYTHKGFQQTFISDSASQNQQSKGPVTMFDIPASESTSKSNLQSDRVTQSLLYTSRWAPAVDTTPSREELMKKFSNLGAYGRLGKTAAAPTKAILVEDPQRRQDGASNSGNAPQPLDPTARGGLPPMDPHVADCWAHRVIIPTSREWAMCGHASRKFITPTGAVRGKPSPAKEPGFLDVARLGKHDLVEEDVEEAVEEGVEDAEKKESSPSKRVLWSFGRSGRPATAARLAAATIRGRYVFVSHDGLGPSALTLLQEVP